MSALTRNKITPTAASAMCHSLISACNGLPSAVNLHFTTAYRYKVEVHNTIVEKIKSTWTPTDTALVQWDRKLMDTLDGASTEERLPILLSGIGGRKLLGVPVLKSSKCAEDLIAEAAIALLEECNCK